MSQQMIIAKSVMAEVLLLKNNYMFFKKGITTKEQVTINKNIGEMINLEHEDKHIQGYLINHWDFTKEEAEKELKKAKLFMGWYAIK